MQVIYAWISITQRIYEIGIGTSIYVTQLSWFGWINCCKFWFGCGISCIINYQCRSYYLGSFMPAPCPVETVADWWWWINFSCKWHSVYFRMLMFVHDTANINQQYLDDHYCQFYGDENFQRWSMVDRKHKIDGSLITYKWHARQLVADICGKEYLSKVKKGSLWRLLSFKKSADLLDNDYNYIFNAVPDDWYEPDNSFGYFATS